MRKSTIAVVGALTLAVVAVPTVASASNGHAWLLGRSNAETTATTVTNSKGTPLSLKAKSGYAPLAVNSTKTVTNLSADRLDGLSSGSFMRATAASSFASAKGVTATIVASDLDTPAKCPTGTVLVGGDGMTLDEGVDIFYSGPAYDQNGKFVPNSWIVFGEADYSTSVSYATCYSPSGKAIPGARTVLPTQYMSMITGGVAPASASLSSTAKAGIKRLADVTNR